MNQGILSGLRVIEGSAFVAAPLAGNTLAALGADVIRFDPIGGGLDAARWPVTRRWAVAVLGRHEQGQALDRGRHPRRARPAAAERTDRSKGAGRGAVRHQLPGARLAGLRQAGGAAAGSDHGQPGRPARRRLGGGLHGESATGLSRHHRAGFQRGADQPCVPGLGRDHRQHDRHRAAGRTAPPRPHRRGPAGDAGAEGRGPGDAGPPGHDRRGAGGRFRPAALRQ